MGPWCGGGGGGMMAGSGVAMAISWIDAALFMDMLL
jgi:hypothetical protein